jgi:hypothetical protein
MGLLGKAFPVGAPADLAGRTAASLEVTRWIHDRIGMGIGVDAYWLSEADADVGSDADADVGERILAHGHLDGRLAIIDLGDLRLEAMLGSGVFGGNEALHSRAMFAIHGGPILEFPLRGVVTFILRADYAHAFGEQSTGILAWQLGVSLYRRD